MKNKNWLPHLTNEMMIGARNYNLCSYLVSLEGWRRGLTLKWYSDKVQERGVHAPGRLFSLSSEEKTHIFYNTKGDKVSREALKIAGSKDLTKKWLSKYDVPVPEGKSFREDVPNDEILEYAKKLGFPVVLKPINGSQGRGVISNILNEESFKVALEHLRIDLNLFNVIVERYVAGNEYRVFVIEDTVLAVLNRIPANVIGDGVHSIKKLIEIRNRERKKNPRLYNCLIKIDFEIKKNIKKSNLTLDSVPEKGEQIFLREKSNISTGGDSVDVTDKFPLEIKEVAINALKVMPGLPHGGVDIIVNWKESLDKAAFVLEINAIPQIGSLVFPMEGQARDIPSGIIDYYFPETRDKKNYNSRVYFDFKGVLQPLMSKIARETTVLPAPINLTFAKKYIMTGKVQGVRYRRWIRKQALESDLYGYAQNLNDGSVVVVVAGTEESVNQFKDTCEKGSKSSQVSSVSETVWNRPIKIGFEIKAAPRLAGKEKLPKKQVKLTRLTGKQRIKVLLRRIIKFMKNA